MTDEGRALKIFCGGIDDGELRQQSLMELRIMGDRVAEVEDCRLFRGSHLAVLWGMRENVEDRDIRHRLGVARGVLSQEQ